MSDFELNKYALDIARKVISKGQVVDKDVITQSIETILMTDRYERVFEPNFGSFLSTIVFERLDTASATNLLDQIIALISKFETRVRVISSACRLVIDRPNHSLELKIVYAIIGGSVEQFNKRIVF